MRRAPFHVVPRPTPLAGWLSLLLAPVAAASAVDTAIPAGAADATGMTIAVQNCNDSGPGSLRAAVTGALSGDTIDLTGLGCHRIDLTSGAIMIPQDNLAFRGVGHVTVDGNRLSSLFRHSGAGLLHIRGMKFERGFHNDTTPRGGCIYSAGRISLEYTWLRWCLARRSGAVALGGGIYAIGDVSLSFSQVLDSTAAHGGGGIFARGRVTTYRSRVHGNFSHTGAGLATLTGLHANYTDFSANRGGDAILAEGDTIIANSTISANKAPRTVVTLRAFPTQAGGGSALIANSTISGNTTGYHTVSLVEQSGPPQADKFAASIVNSTIAFNQHADALDDDCLSLPGTVYLVGMREPTHVESTIIADNTCNGSPYHDIGAAGSSVDPVVQGANNLITRSDLQLPPDTISADARLAPLADNGGRTMTHALLDGSPAIDMGNDSADLAYDQRGPGYPRVKGTQADIGAYER